MSSSGKLWSDGYIFLKWLRVCSNFLHNVECTCRALLLTEPVDRYLIFISRSDQRFSYSFSLCWHLSGCVHKNGQSYRSHWWVFLNLVDDRGSPCGVQRAGQVDYRQVSWDWHLYRYYNIVGWEIESGIWEFFYDGIGSPLSLTWEKHLKMKWCRIIFKRWNSLILFIS